MAVAAIRAVDKCLKHIANSPWDELSTDCSMQVHPTLVY